MNRVDIIVIVIMTAGIALAALLTLAIFLYLNPLGNVTLSAESGLAIVTAISTIVLVIVTALQMLEARKLRLESVRPSLSLEPAHFHMGGGFMQLQLTNSGISIRDVEIDVTYSGKTDCLYISSIGTSQRVPVIAKGNLTQAGGVVTVDVRYKDLYGKHHTENLSIDFDSINKAKRKFAYVLSPLDVVTNDIKDLERATERVERAIRDLSRDLKTALDAIERKL